ncbi:MAG: polysaccharide pyruvyl transferase family protein, partial [Lewinella sp.]|nr:polysaccharide pyruvyl transferase family protein [Lewinella sp.]
NGDFINVLARKSVAPLSPNAFYDDPSAVRARVAAYDKGTFRRKLKSRFEKFSKARKRLKNGLEDLVYPFADAMYDFLSRRKKYRLSRGPSVKSGLNLTHVAFFGHYNAGDTLLPVVLRDLYDRQLGRSAWNKQHVHKVVDRRALARINSSDGLVIGGGGLFLRDTNPNQLSGWQWSCSLDTLDKIKVPISVFAVGYNRFRGQPDFAPVFRDHLRLLAEKSVFIGLRNYGSIEQVKAYLPPELHHKLRFQPCMTTLAASLYGDQARRSPEVPPFIALNCAFDRPQFRYGEKMGEMLTELARGIKAVSRLAPIHYYAHHPDDEHFLPYLEALEVDFRLERLYKRPPAIVLEAYRKPLLVLGMRGHAQLIPFGCERPILSVVSHNKLQYFLDDIQAPDWGIDINQPNLPDMLFHKVDEMIRNLDAYEQAVIEKQARLWQITAQNLEEIKKSYGA